MDKTEALIRLNHLLGWGAMRLRKLIDACGCPIGAWNCDQSFLSDIGGIPQSLIKKWDERKKLTSWEEDLRLVEQQNIKLISYKDPLYPKHLIDIRDPPILLYVSGTLSPSDQTSVAVIGTRDATHYGMESARLFASGLASARITITSGLARGIDTAAHEAALKKGRTLAVIGSGLARIYPPENRLLASCIAENGAVISEFPMNRAPDTQTFPQRNRIVSGLSKGVLLIEAPVRSGAMITMNLGAEQGKRLWALPGRVDFPSFEGNHYLLKRRIADLVCQPADILASLGDFFGELPAVPQKVTLNEEEQTFFNLLPPGEFGVDELSALTKLPVAKISVLLMRLVLRKVIKELPGKRFTR